MRTLAAIATITVLGFAGCSGEDPFDTGRTRSAAPEAMGITTDTVESAGAPVAKQEAPEPAPQPERKKAEAGVTGRGNYGGGFGTTALSTRVRVQEKLEFLQVDQALNLYKASTGALPKTHEEFMEKIIKANQINLPQLQPGDKYIYDPEKGQLMVEKEVEKK
ncbi:MAG: hypothetical protein GXX96_06700 [Planctomycetaceae bacterium]|nr:hypothetical protein [Planctomycetaceae bacterium]